MIAGLLLAAGRSTRFGADKLMATLGDRPVVAWSAAALAAGVDEAWAVTGVDDGAIAAALSPLGMRLVDHAGRDAGMGSTIAAGVRVLPRDAEAVVIALGDQPLAQPAVVRMLCARWRETQAPVVAPEYRDGRGHPVLFARRCFAALAALDGDDGARGIIRTLADEVVLVSVPGAMPLDVDTPEALAAVARALASA